jgi:nuclease HARBI1
MHALGVLYLDNPEIFHWRMPYYAERVQYKCGVTESFWGFIDGTLCKTCCPSYFQKLMYSGHKHCHGIMFQSIVTLDGLFASMYGPVNGNRHDSFLLSTSGLLEKLQAFMPDLPGTVVFSLYGDPAYSQSIYIFGGYKNPLNGSTHVLWNTTMSKVCEEVEWGFANILSQWSFLDFRA